MTSGITGTITGAGWLSFWTAKTSFALAFKSAAVKMPRPARVGSIVAIAGSTDAFRPLPDVGRIELSAMTPSPPTTATTQIDVPNARMPRFGTTLARPQNVIGPPAAAANSNVAAGAVPIPTSSNAATSGISNNSGTLMRMPKVAAITIPTQLSPRYVATVSGLTHWMTNALANPAKTIIGPSLTR